MKAFLCQPHTRLPRLLAGQDAASSLLWGNWLYWPSLAFRSEALRAHDFRDSFPIIQDLALLIDIIADGGALLYYPKLCFQYRRHSESLSAVSTFDGRRFDGEYRYFELAAELMRRNGWNSAARIAKMHLLSRLDAVTAMPLALQRKDGSLGKLFNYVIKL